MKDALLKRHASLASERDAVKSAVNAHNQKCHAVPPDSAIADQCRSEQQSLQVTIEAYSEKVRKFNSDVSASLKVSSADNLDCSQINQTYKRISAGLPVQKEAMDRTEALLNSLNEELGIRENPDVILRKSVDSYNLAVQNLTKEYKALREQVQKQHKKLFGVLSGSQAKSYSEWVKQVDLLEKFSGGLQSGMAGYEYGQEIQKRNRTIWEHVELAAKLLQDSGVAQALAGATFGPVGEVGFFAASEVLDAAAANWMKMPNTAEYLRARDSLATMRSQYERAESELGELKMTLDQKRCTN
jgi:hypothetical protein